MAKVRLLASINEPPGFPMPTRLKEWRVQRKVKKRSWLDKISLPLQASLPNGGTTPAKNMYTKMATIMA
jgi:hypothetical protein